MQAPVRVAALARPATLVAGLRLAAVLSLLASLLIAGALAARPFVDPPPARAMGPLPACRYDDILTSPRGYDDWSTTLVDTILRLPSTYAPPDLVRVVDLGVPGKGKVRAVMSEDLKAMSDAAAAADAAIGVHSPYRSYSQQVSVYNSWVNYYGVKRARQLSARPGHSEHQLGLAIDFQSEPPVATLATSWAATPAGKWMRVHAWEYGFIMSYPKGRIATVCYDYEPWHFRYVGKELAAQVHSSGLTLREYLWKHFTTTVVPAVTPKPPSTPRPSHSHAPSTSGLPSTPPSLPATAEPAATTGPPTAPASISATAAASPGPASPGVEPAPTAAPAPTDSVPPQAGLAAAAGLGIGTIVLGGAFLLRRRGRSGVGL
jgi:D-alanyl-D-alanine carboxypeptidase